MDSFKQYLLNELFNVKPVENEAMLVLQKIIDMVDDGHVDYDTKKIRINVGRLIKDKRYNNLDIYIVKGNEDIKVGRHSDDNRHAIFIYATTLPKRENIDDFLSDGQRAAKFKASFVKFFNDAVFDESDDNDGSDYEKASSLNNRTSFEKSYIELVAKLNNMMGEFNMAKKELDDRMEKASEDLGHKEVINMSITKLKREMLGSNVNEFKSKAIDLYGKEQYKLLDKDFKSKLDARLTDYYEHKVK